jgi:hypothetical protein
LAYFSISESAQISCAASSAIGARTPEGEFVISSSSGLFLENCEIPVSHQVLHIAD